MHWMYNFWIHDIYLKEEGEWWSWTFNDQKCSTIYWKIKIRCAWTEHCASNTTWFNPPENLTLSISLTNNMKVVLRYQLSTHYLQYRHSIQRTLLDKKTFWQTSVGGHGRGSYLSSSDEHDLHVGTTVSYHSPGHLGHRTRRAATISCCKDNSER